MRITKAAKAAKAAVGGLTLATLVVTGAGPAGAQEAPAETRACRHGTWPASAEGRPAGFAPGAATGVYLWHTGAGWHLRVTHPGTDRVAFKGTVTSASRIQGVERRTESRDALVQRSRHRIAFRFANYGRVDGVDFRVACGRGFSVNGTVNGQPLAPDQVFIGADGHHPAQVPFRIERQR